MSVIAKNMMSLFLSQVATWAITIVLLVFAPRRLGASDWGQLQFGVTYVGFFMLVGLLGTSTYLVKETARDQSAVGLYVFNTLLMKLALTAALTVLAIGLASVLGFSRETVLIIAAGCVGMVLQVLNDVLYSGLQGMERMSAPAAFNVLGHYVGSVLAIVVLFTHGSLVLYALVLSSIGIVPLVANSVLLLPRIRSERRLDFQLWRKVAKGGLPFLTWSGLLLIYGTIDIPLLQALTDSETVGWYTLAYRWVSMPAFIATIVVTAILPKLSAHGKTVSEEFTRTANRGLRLVFFVSAPIAAGIAVVAGSVLPLIYHSDFDNAIPIMQILALHIPIVAMDTVLGMTLIAADKQKQWVFVACAAAAMNPLLNLAAIPITRRAFDNGAIGAATITVGTELLMMIGALVLRPRGVMDRSTASFVVRCAVASAALIPVVWAMGDLWLPARVAAGVVTYALGSLALGTLTLPALRQASHQFLVALRLRT